MLESGSIHSTISTLSVFVFLSSPFCLSPVLCLFVRIQCRFCQLGYITRVVFRVPRSKRIESHSAEEESGGNQGAGKTGVGGDVDTGGEAGRRKEKQGGAAGLRAILKEGGGRGGGGGGGGGNPLGGKEGRGRSARLWRRGWSEEGKAYRPRSEMARRSKEKKGRGGGGRGEGGGGGVKGVGGSKSLSGSRSSLGRREDSSGEDLLMVRRYRSRGRSLGPKTGSRVSH